MIEVKHQELAKFILVGVVNTVSDFLLFLLLANVIGIQPVVANVISVGICMCISFVLNMKYVWKSKRAVRETAPRFFAVTIFSGWVVQGVIIWVFTLLGESWIINMVAKMAAIGVGMTINFLAYSMIFKEKPGSE